MRWSEETRMLPAAGKRIRNVHPGNCCRILHLPELLEAQDMAIALEAAEIALNGKGACRVHGGGFAGTIQAFVPTESVSEFCEKMELMLRKGCCHVLNIRPTGGIVL